jgi:hypothetical protein
MNTGPVWSSSSMVQCPRSEVGMTSKSLHLHRSSQARLQKSPGDHRWPEISHRWHKGTIGHHLRPSGSEGSTGSTRQSPTKSKVESVWHCEAWSMWTTLKYEHRSCWNTWRPNCMCPSPTMAGALHLPYMFLTCQLIDTISGGSMWTCSGWHRLSKYFPIFLSILQHSSCFSSCFPVQLAILQAKSMFPRSSLGSWQDLGLRLRWPLSR